MSEENITRIELDGKEIILIGTAHVSKQSALQVKEVIEAGATGLCLCQS